MLLSSALASGARYEQYLTVDPADIVVAPRVDLRLFDEELLLAFIEHDTDAAAQLLDAELEPQWPDAHDEAFLRTRLAAARDEDVAMWGPRAVIRRLPTRRMIGHAGFHGPPGINALGLAEAVEVGYTVFPGSRRVGFATEVAGALMDWACQQHAVTSFVASVSPDNADSLAVVRKLGFEFVREMHDDVDGVELVHVLIRPA